MGKLSDILDAILNDRSRDYPDVGTVHSDTNWGYPGFYHSLAAIRSMRDAEERVGKFHDVTRGRGNYPDYDPSIPRDFSPAEYGPSERGNLIRHIDEAGLGGTFNSINNRDARQVLLGIAESQYRNQHPEGQMSHQGHPPPDTEIIIRKKHPQPKENKPSQQDEGSQSIIRQRRVNPMRRYGGEEDPGQGGGYY